jgi:hypothetical protein
MSAHPLSPNDHRSIAKVRLVTVLFCSLLAVNDLSIYFGVHSESVQAMFSGLLGLDTHNNHLFMPQFHITSIGDYYFVSSVRIEGVNANTEELQAIQRWLLARQGKKTLVYNQVIRSITRRLCNHGGSVRLQLRSVEGREINVENACRDAIFASENRWIPIRLHPASIEYGTLQWLWQ